MRTVVSSIGRMPRRLAIATVCEHTFVRWDRPGDRAGRAGPAPGLPRRRRAPFRRAGGARHPVLRSPRQVGAQPRPGAVADAVPLDDQPVRGCSHACAYCAGGDTPILMADGRTRELRHIRPGDRIYGTVMRGRVSPLRDHRGARPLVVAQARVPRDARGRHGARSRAATTGSSPNRGWKHVTGAEQGPLQRPHLTRQQQARWAPARFAEPPRATVDYKRGYLCGMIRGDGHLGTRVLRRGRTGGAGSTTSFRLALADLEALSRAQGYLADLSVETTAFQFAAAHGQPPGGARDSHASRARSVDAIREHHRLARRDPLDWCKGFLAGIFDAEGSFSGSGIVRIATPTRRSSTGPRSPAGSSGSRSSSSAPATAMWNVRIRGGLEQQLRFFHLTDPAITRKRSIEGRALKSQSRLKVVEIEPLGMELPLYDITTGTGDFIANGVVQPQLLRPPHARVPGLQRRPRLRQGDRRQGQRARGAAGRAGAAVVEARARRAGDEHRPVPVGRGALQADARDLGGDAGLRQPVLDPHEVAAAAARQGPAAADRRAHDGQRVPVGPDARREGVAGDRAAHAAPAGAAGGGGGAQPDRASRPGS